MIWTDNSFPFPFGKDCTGFFYNCLLCGTFIFFYSLGPISLSFPAPFRMQLAGLGSTKKLPFLLSFLLGFSFGLCCAFLFSFVFYLTLSGTKDRDFPHTLSHLFIDPLLQLIPGNLLLPNNNTLNKLARKGALLKLSPPLVSSHFCRWNRDLLPPQNFSLRNCSQ